MSMTLQYYGDNELDEWMETEGGQRKSSMITTGRHEAAESGIKRDGCLCFSIFKALKLCSCASKSVLQSEYIPT